MYRKKILIIDDEQPIRLLLESQLERSGFTVESAADGLTGLKKALKARPDLILLDVMMPRMNGFEVCRRIRNHPELAEVPVIFLTASMTRENRVQAFAVGANDYVVKPFRRTELLAQISAVLRPNQDSDSACGRVVALLGVSSGVGTTTLAIQLSKAMAVNEDRPVMVVDLDMSRGDLAACLQLYHQPHVLDLLALPAEELTLTTIRRFAQRHRAGLLVIPTPHEPVNSTTLSTSQVTRFLASMRAAGYLVVLDLGSTINDLTLSALKDADLACIVSSGEPLVNEQHDSLLAAVRHQGVNTQRLFSVINEVHGATAAQPAFPTLAHIAQVSERGRPYLWLQDQGMQKLCTAVG